MTKAESAASRTQRTDALRRPYVIYKKRPNGTYSSCVSKTIYDKLLEQFSTLELEAADLRERLAKAREEARNQARESLSFIEAILKSLTHPTPPTVMEWAELRGIARAHLATIEAQKGAEHE